jgi:hypothetical protein
MKVTKVRKKLAKLSEKIKYHDSGRLKKTKVVRRKAARG